MSHSVLIAFWMLFGAWTPEWEISWQSPASLSTTPVEIIELEDGSIVMLSVARLSGGLDDAWLTRWDQAEFQDPEAMVPTWSVRLADPALWSTGRLVSDHSGGVLLLAANFSRLVIEQRSSSNGAMQWRDEQALDPGTPHVSYRPLLALGGEEGPILAAAVSGQGVWLGRWTLSGALLDSELLIDDQGSASPTDIAVDFDASIAVGAIVQDVGGGGRFRTWFQSLSGTALGEDVEPATLGEVFGPHIATDGLAGWIVQAGLESECGVFQTRVWRIDQTFQRDWSWFGPQSPCDSWLPVALHAAADGPGAVLVGAHDDGGQDGLAVVQLNGKGQLVRREKWVLGPAGGRPYPLHATDNQLKLLMVAGLEAGVGFNAGFVSLWTPQGELCQYGTSDLVAVPASLTALELASGRPAWLVATSLISAGQSGMRLQWYRAPLHCIDRVLFDRFQQTAP